MGRTKEEPLFKKVYCINSLTRQKSKQIEPCSEGIRVNCKRTKCQYYSLVWGLMRSYSYFIINRPLAPHRSTRSYLALSTSVLCSMYGPLWLATVVYKINRPAHCVFLPRSDTTACLWPDQVQSLGRPQASHLSAYSDCAVIITKLFCWMKDRNRSIAPY